MNTKLIYAALLFAASCTSCTKSALDASEPELRGLALATSETTYEDWFASEAGLVQMPVSRVTETNFQALDSIGVFIYTGTASAIGAGPYHSTNMLYYTKDGTPDGSTSPRWTAAEAMGGPFAVGTTYYTTSYYPYKSTERNGSTILHSVATDQTPAFVTGTAKALEKSDFMWAPPVAVVNPTTAPTATMTFQHLLTKLVLNVQIPTIVDGAPATKLNSIAIKNLNTRASIHLGTGALSNLAAVSDIKPRLLSGNGNAGTTNSYEAIVMPQTAAAGVVLVEAKIQTSAGEKTASYFPPTAGLALGGGKKITLSLMSAADIAFTSEVDLATGQAYSDLPLKVKVASGVAWTLTAPASSWITVASTAGGAYGVSVTGTGTGAEQTVYVKTTTNTGAGATPRQAVLTLSGTISGTARSVTYTAVQNYSKPIVYPAGNVIMDYLNYQMPVLDGNSSWYLKSTNIPSGARFSRRNVAWSALTASDTLPVFTLSTVLPKNGYLVSGNYFNTGGALYIVTDPNQSPIFDMTCDGVAVKVDARTIYIPQTGLRWARGNLVGVTSTTCKIGAATDAGLLFRSGALIGWEGGTNLNGTGVPKDIPTTIWNVKPKEFTATPVWTTYNENTAVNPYMSFQNYPWTIATHYNSGADNPAAGLGDACRYYLGAGWRMINEPDFEKLVDKTNLGSSTYALPYANKDGSLTIIGPGAPTVDRTASVAFAISGTRGWLRTDLWWSGTNAKNYYIGHRASSSSSATGYFAAHSAGSFAFYVDSQGYEAGPIRCVTSY